MYLLYVLGTGQISEVQYYINKEQITVRLTFYYNFKVVFGITLPLLLLELKHFLREQDVDPETLFSGAGHCFPCECR